MYIVWQCFGVVVLCYGVFCVAVFWYCVVVLWYCVLVLFYCLAVLWYCVVVCILHASVLVLWGSVLVLCGSIVVLHCSVVAVCGSVVVVFGSAVVLEHVTSCVTVEEPSEEACRVPGTAGAGQLGQGAHSPGEGGDWDRRYCLPVWTICSISHPSVGCGVDSLGLGVGCLGCVV